MSHMIQKCKLGFIELLTMRFKKPDNMYPFIYFCVDNFRKRYKANV